MNTSQLEDIKRTAKKLEARVYFHLLPDFDETFIEQFAKFMHPYGLFSTTPGRCTVKLPGTIYTYTLYTTGIIRTQYNSSQRIFYSLPKDK